MHFHVEHVLEKHPLCLVISRHVCSPSLSFFHDPSAALSRRSGATACSQCISGFLQQRRRSERCFGALLLYLPPPHTHTLAACTSRQGDTGRNKFSSPRTLAHPFANSFRSPCLSPCASLSPCLVESVCGDALYTVTHLPRRRSGPIPRFTHLLGGNSRCPSGLLRGNS